MRDHGTVVRNRFLLARQHESEKIAVGRKLLAQTIADPRQGGVSLFAAKQNFGGSKTARGNNDALCDHAIQRVAAGAQIPKVQTVAMGSVGGRVLVSLTVERRNLFHQMLGAQISLVSVLGDEKIIQIQSILRVRIAAQIALRAINTGCLQGTVAIPILLADGKWPVEIVSEKDVDVGELRGPPQFFRHFLESLGANDSPARIVVLWNGTCAQHLLRNAKVGH